MLKMVVLTLLLFPVAASAQTRHYSHTVIDDDGSRVTYRTRCTGSYERHCTTIVSELPPPRRGSHIYTGPVLPDKNFCKVMRKSYGENLERFAYPIGDNVSYCIADEALQIRIRAANVQERMNGREGKTMNPLYQPPK